MHFIHILHLKDFGMADKPHNKSFPGNILSTGDIARYCEVTVPQVNRWIKNGELNAFRHPGGHYRVTKEKFREFLERNGMPIIEDFFQSSKKTKILIADDDATIVDAFSLLLSTHYSEVDIEVSYDGYETLVKTGEFKPDLLILDIKMPKIDGLEVCRRLREDIASTQKIKIIAITAHSDAYDRETVLAHGADAYLIKPIDSKTLLENVEKLI